MARVVEIIYKGTDNLSNSIKDIKHNGLGLKKEIDSCEEEKQKLFDAKAQKKLELTQAKNELKKFTKEIKKGDVINEGGKNKKTDDRER